MRRTIQPTEINYIIVNIFTTYTYGILIDKSGVFSVRVIKAVE